MLLSPLFVLVTLVVGAAAVYGIARFWPRYVAGTAVAAAVLAILIWLILRSQLPLEFLLPASTVNPYWPRWGWRIDLVAWQLSGVVLVLVTAVLLVMGSDNLRSGGATTYGRERVRSGEGTLSLVLLLAAAALLTVWGATMPVYLIGWTLVVLIWLGLLWLDNGAALDVPRLKMPLMLYLIPILLLWLAVLLARTGILDISGWPNAAITAVLIAIAFQISAWPLHRWQRAVRFKSPLLDGLGQIMPAVVGFSLLARLAGVTGLAVGAVYLLALSGLLGLFAGIRQALIHWRSQSQMAPGITMAIIHLTLLIGLWTTGEVVASSVRTLALAGGMLFLAASIGNISRHRWWRLVALVVAQAALVGLPLTAGFVGLSSLYDTWLAGGSLLLVLVTALLHVPLVTAVTLYMLQDFDEENKEIDAAGTSISRWLGDMALLLTAVGLISLAGLTSLRAISILTWLAILLPPAAGILLYHYAGGKRDWQTAWHRAFSFDLPLRMVIEQIRDGLRWLNTAVGDALAILEGEGALLWLLAFLLLFWLVT